ncbi:hydroxymethylglutaryl-CoA lyase [Lentisalinibacter orientalis]|uniref:hydroxymethylglutaryl-CoA lyase n=1 Tax=Lentisalinibacter orientalis TaxID=2992241 RepID=UPI00386613FF
MSTNTTRILVSEVGPRDGLQSIETIMPTEAKKAWIAAEAEAGVREIEVGSFVPPKLLPQLADTAEIVRYARTLPGLTVAALVPNLRGAQDAIAAGAHKITLPLSVSETHSKANLRKTHAEVLEEVRAIVQLLGTLPADERPEFEGGLSTAFGCTLEGPVDERRVVELAVRLMELGCDEVGLSDTTGYANPAQLQRLVKLVRAEVGDDALTGVHLHNTRGLGLANALAALDVGITTLDASLGGIGGCPFAPGASGNIVTEDLVFMLDSMGYDTGIDIEKLLRVRDIVREALPDEELYGFTPDAGLPKGYRAPWGLPSAA